MATASSSPTARRFELARRLRELRLAADRSVEEVAAELMCSPAKISRMETAGRSIQQRDVRDLCRFYGVSKQIQDELMQFALDAGKRGWWQDYRVLDEQTRTFVGLESAAAEMLEFEIYRMPGLLQVPEYARAWVESMRTPNFWKPGEVDDLVEVRMRRQDRVLNGSLNLHAILDEAVFARIVGSLEVMKGQARRLAEWARFENVELQVMPFSAGPHPGLDGSFLYLQFEPTTLADIVFIEGWAGNQILDREEDTRRYREVHEYLSSLAMSEAETIAWLGEYVDQLALLGESSATPYRLGW